MTDQDKRGRKKGPLPKGPCSECGRIQPLRSNGTIFAHHIKGPYDARLGYSPRTRCPGSYQPPDGMPADIPA